MNVKKLGIETGYQLCHSLVIRPICNRLLLTIFLKALLSSSTNKDDKNTDLLAVMRTAVTWHGAWPIVNAQSVLIFQGYPENKHSM